MGKTLSVLATALLATTIGAATPACSMLDKRIENTVNRTINSRESRIKEDLEDILQSVHCVKRVTVYEQVDAPKGTPKRSFTGYGTAFAYEKKDGFTYLVTNSHVAEMPDTAYSVERSPEGLMLKYVFYKKVSENLTLVDNYRDTNTKDDIPVHKVRSDKDKDIAVLRTQSRLYLSDRFAFDASFTPRRGDEAYILGYPKALVRAQTKGIVAEPGFKASDGSRYDALDVTGTFGNSGSPYFIRRGKTLYWAGTVGALIPHRESHTSLFMLGIPIRQYKDLLTPVGTDAKTKAGNTPGDAGKPKR